MKEDIGRDRPLREEEEEWLVRRSSQGKREKRVLRVNSSWQYHCHITKRLKMEE